MKREFIKIKLEAPIKTKHKRLEKNDKRTLREEEETLKSARRKKQRESKYLEKS